MKLDLHSPARKRVTAAMVVLAAGVYLGLTAREFVASWFGNRPELKSLQRAVWLDAGNAEYRNHVGRYYDLVGRDPATAIAHYKTAVQLNPHSARYWFDLASAYQVMGDTQNQTQALEQAIHADGTTPDVAWEAANLYLVQGEYEKALREFHVVMANDSSLANLSIQYAWRMDPDVDMLLRDVVPHTTDALVPFLGLLESKQETDATYKVWNALIESGDSFEKRYAFDYFQYLIRFNQVDKAQTVWQQTVDRFGLSSYLASSNNLVANGSFDFDPLNAGFDWQYQRNPGVQLTLDPTDHHSGRRSLLINFDGPAINDAGIFQLIPVQPNTTYDFGAYYKNGEMEGAGGPHLTIQDMYSQAIYYESDELKEAGFWKSVDGEFTTGPACRLVMLHIRRLPSGSPIRGKLWVDDFHLTKKSS